MTIILAIEHQNKLYFGGDRYCGNPDNNSIDLCDTPKVYAVGNVLIGICGSVKCEQILEACAKKHFTKRKNITRDWIQNSFCEILQKEMERRNVLVEAADGQKLMPDDSSFLIGVKNEIIVLLSDFSIFRSNNKFAALGIGADSAKGALHALSEFDMDPREKILLALRASEQCCDKVRAPFDVISNCER
jgi:ATP-dependent protease HslVU (ClpYQ) peptidase subunit